MTANNVIRLDTVKAIKEELEVQLNIFSVLSEANRKISIGLALLAIHKDNPSPEVAAQLKVLKHSIVQLEEQVIQLQAALDMQDK